MNSLRDIAHLSEHIRWQFYADSDVGRVRTQNEDCFGADDPPGLFIVADGMGGHAAGEVASGLAVRCMREGISLLRQDATREAVRTRMREAIADANRVILLDGQAHAERAGMGTTTTALLLSPQGWWVVGHVGDSRAYLVRNGEVTRITEDHTYVQELVNEGRISEEEARVHPRSSLLTRALGTGTDVEVDVISGDLTDGDRFVITSDGLMAMLPEPRIEHLLTGGYGREALVEKLIAEANQAGGHDNVTTIVVDAGS